MGNARADTLYHYTDFVALDGILAGAELRLNNVLNMNDASEMNLFMRSLCKNIADSFVREGDEKKSSLTWLIFMNEQEHRFSYSAYAACFSRYRDDAAQWERYGNGGRGVCIAFDDALLERITDGALSMRPVVYVDDVGEHELVAELHDLIGRVNITDPDSIPDELRDALNRAWEVSATYKHPSFSSENEVRLLISPFGKGYIRVQPQYHISKERIKKYYPIDLNRMCQSAGTNLEKLITELIIGPESHQSIPILQDYLHSLSFDRLAERVSYSNCPLRRTIL